MEERLRRGRVGLGRMTQPLTLGCDCLGEIRYLDVTMADEQGRPWTVPNAICLHEEDAGIGWKHVDLMSGGHEVRRSRRMVISHVSTVGNYEYGFSWYLYLDGNIQLEVKLTGIMSVQGVVPGIDSPYATTVATGVAAPVHQHLFCARLDLDVDGTDNRIEEIATEVLPLDDANPWANGFRARSSLLSRESAAQRETHAASSRRWRVSNPHVHNGLGQPVAYQLVPTTSTPTLLARPESSVAQRAGFARHNLWATPYARDERRAAGELPNQHAGGAGLPAWTAADRDLVDTDVVLWYTFGVTHIPRPEDWPVMPVESTGFVLSPVRLLRPQPGPRRAAHALGPLRPRRLSAGEERGRVSSPPRARPGRRCGRARSVRPGGGEGLVEQQAGGAGGQRHDRQRGVVPGRGGEHRRVDHEHVVDCPRDDRGDRRRRCSRRRPCAWCPSRGSWPAPPRAATRDPRRAPAATWT